MSLADNLVAYWKFDEASGNAADSWSGNSLTNNGSITYSTGKVNNGANLGSGKYFTCSDSDQVSTTGDTTWAIWWYPTTLNAQNSFFDKWNFSASQREYEVFANYSGGTTTFYLNVSNDGTSTGTGSRTSTAISVNNWYHVVYVYTASTGNLEVYVNGTSLGTSATGKTAILNGTSQFSIGQFTGGGGNLAGMIDEAAIWRRAISSAEVTELYNSGSGKSVPFDTTSLIQRGPANTNISNSATTVSTTIAPNGNNTIICAAVASGSNSVTGVTYDGMAMTQYGSYVNASLGYNFTLWYLAVGSTSGSSKTIVATRTTATANFLVNAFCYYGVNQSSPINSGNSLNAASPPTSNSFTTTSGAGAVVSVVVGNVSTTSTAGVYSDKSSIFKKIPSYEFHVLDTTQHGGIIIGSFSTTIYSTSASLALKSFALNISEITQTLSATATSSASVLKGLSKTMTSTTTASSTLIKQVLKTLESTGTVTASILKQLDKTLGVTETINTTLSAVKVFLQDLDTTTSISATIQSVQARMLNANASIGVMVTKTAALLREFSATTTINATATKALSRVLDASSAISTTINIGRLKVLSASTAITASINITRARVMNSYATVMTSLTAGRLLTMNATTTIASPITLANARVLSAITAITAKISAPFWRTKYPAHGDGDDYEVKYPHE